MNFSFEAFQEKANSVTTTDVLNQIKGGECDHCHSFGDKRAGLWQENCPPE